MKEIYVAGGCFWGVEAFFKQIPGVKQTKVGYANSKIKNPTYEEVCSETTKAVETTYILYNPKVISLEKLLDFFFRIIDPTAINRQGNDYGSQYRTGVYYVDKNDAPIIAAALNALQTKYAKRIVVENKPLENFYDAELYHQEYLQKNPYGYCHVDLNALRDDEKKVNKPKLYRELISSFSALFTDKSHSISVLSNLSAIIKEYFPKVSWVGVYLDNGNELIVGPFQGRVACETIAYTKGVCGKAFSREEVVIVPDVHEFPGHIACDAGSNSEIVLPLFDASDKLIGVLDLDSYDYDYFDRDDEEYLKLLLAKIKQYLRQGELL